MTKILTSKLSIVLTQILLMLATSHTVAQSENISIPDIGDSAATALTRADEYRVGNSIVRNLRRTGKVIDDPQINDYLDKLGYSLVSAAEQDNARFHFFLMNEGGINAFALPGGFIGLNYGLIMATESESELASVVAHEIAHITQRHHARQYEFVNKSQVPILAAIIAGIILGTSGHADIGQAAIVGATGGSIQMQLNFTRANEKEADRIGINLLSQAGFDPNSMVDFFSKMQREARFYGTQVPEFLLTHPISEDRMADARNRASKMPNKGNQSSKAYYLVKEKIRVLTADDPAKLVSDYQSREKNKDYPHREAFEYGYAMALHRNQQYGKAYKLLETLVKNDPSRIAYIIEQAKLAHDMKQYDKANKIYQSALSLYPANRTLTYEYANNLIYQNQFKTAAELLREITRKNYVAPEFYKLLSLAEQRLGNFTNSHEAMAEYYYQIGQNHQALTQLNLALKRPEIDFYQESRISARKKLIAEEIKLLSSSTL